MCWLKEININLIVCYSVCAHIAVDFFFISVNFDASFITKLVVDCVLVPLFLIYPLSLSNFFRWLLRCSSSNLYGLEDVWFLFWLLLLIQAWLRCRLCRGFIRQLWLLTLHTGVWWVNSDQALWVADIVNLGNWHIERQICRWHGPWIHVRKWLSWFVLNQAIRAVV